MYSQNAEEKHILKFFGDRTGRFLDIGAFDGITFSNVRALYELGWKGVMVEPSPCCFTSLIRNYPKNDVELVNVALGTTSGVAVLHASEDAVSTLSESHQELWKTAANFRKITINQLSVSDFLKAFPGPYEFITLDVEGTNWELLQQIPIMDLGCEMLCVEFGEDGSVMKAYLEGLAWELVYSSAENYIFVRRD